jgi:hypothetical protein
MECHTAHEVDTAGESELDRRAGLGGEVVFNARLDGERERPDLDPPLEVDKMDGEIAVRVGGDASVKWPEALSESASSPDGAGTGRS